MTTPVLVIGGTRGTGLLAVHRLRARGVAVRVLARDPARLAGRAGAGVEVMRGDVTRPETLAPAREAGGITRIVYMTSIGGVTPSIPATLLNLVKGNVLAWRRRAEDAIRASGIPYSIVRAGFLMNGAGGTRAIRVTQGDLPLRLRDRIARADVAEILVEALFSPAASGATFEVAWGAGPREDIAAMANRLEPDK